MLQEEAMRSEKLERAKKARARSRMIRSVTGVSTSRRRNTEHEIQVRCVNWLRYACPTAFKYLFAVPNGGLRDEATVEMLKAEGMRPGVADLILLKGNGYHSALCIEMKSKTGRPSKEQKAWRDDVTSGTNDARYVICRSLEDFQREVTDYLRYIQHRHAQDLVILMWANRFHEELKRRQP